MGRPAPPPVLSPYSRRRQKCPYGAGHPVGKQVTASLMHSARPGTVHKIAGCSKKKSWLRNKSRDYFVIAEIVLLIQIKDTVQPGYFTGTTGFLLHPNPRLRDHVPWREYSQQQPQARARARRGTSFPRSPRGVFRSVYFFPRSFFFFFQFSHNYFT